MSYYLYIPYSKYTGKYYIGSAGDLADRLRRHNDGRSKYTKPGIPWELIYYEEYGSRSDAAHREMEIKAWKDRAMVERLVRTFRS